MTDRNSPINLSLFLRKKSSLREQVIRFLLFFCAAVSVLVTFGIVIILLTESVAFFQKISFKQFFLDTKWTPLFARKHFGIWALVSGTVLTSFYAIITALPLGLLLAVYLSEYASPRQRARLKPLLEVLAGIPTVVYGYFALTFLTPLLQKFIPGLMGFNAMSPGIVMGIMITPIIASLSEDALFSVPSEFREGAVGLGGGKLKVIFKVILPSAFSGIAASVILGISRAIGETMIVTIAAGQQARFTFDPKIPVETMTAYIVQVSLGDTPHGTLEYNTIFVVGMMLFLLTMLFNLTAYFLKKNSRKGYF